MIYEVIDPVTREAVTDCDDADQCNDSPPCGGCGGCQLRQAEHAGFLLRKLGPEIPPLRE